MIKTDEESLSIIHDARGLFEQWQDFPGIEHIKGFDTNRMCEYEIWCCDGSTFNGVSKSMKVARIMVAFLVKLTTPCNLSS